MNKHSIKPFSTFNLDNTLLLARLERSFIRYALRNKKNFYKSKIVEKNGKVRLIYPSYYGLKKLQSFITDDLCSKVIFPNYVHGSIKGKSQKTNALDHSKKKQVLSTDIRNFFPSIKKNKVLESLITNGMDNRTAKILAELFTFKGSVQIGTPSSSFLANLVFLPIDKLINKYCRKQGFTYSRYVDDIFISGEKKIQPHFGVIKKIIENEGFEIAKEKTKFMGRNKPQLVTKLVVNDKVRPKFKYTSQLKKTIRANLEQINSKDKQRIKGRINFIKNYDKKIGREVRALLVKNIKD